MHIKKIKISIMITALTLLVTGCSTFMSSNDYYGISTSGKNIVFAIDIPGSMEGLNEGDVSDKLRAEAMNKAGSKVGSFIGGRMGSFVSSSIKKNTTKLASPKRELGPAARGLSADSRFTIITFSDKAEFWENNLQNYTGSSKTRASASLERLSTTGGTAALKGLKAAFPVRVVDTIFFLPDGFPSDASSSRILREVSRLNRSKKITIHSIGLGDNKNDNFLKSLTDENSGNYEEGLTSLGE